MATTIISGSLTNDQATQTIGNWSVSYDYARSGNDVTYTFYLWTVITAGSGWNDDYAGGKLTASVTGGGSKSVSTSQPGTVSTSITITQRAAQDSTVQSSGDFSKAGHYGSVGRTDTTSWSGPIFVPAGGNFTVSYASNGGTGTTSSQTGALNSQVKLQSNDFSRTGYNFDGWKANNTGNIIAPGTSYTITNDVTMYAQWSLQQYSITANLDGGSGTFNTLTKVYGTNKQIWTNTPTKDKYIFQYWQDQQGTQYNPGANYTKDYANVLTAIWKKANIPVYVKQNNTLYQVEKAYTKVNNELKECTVYTKVGGQLKPIT